MTQVSTVRTIPLDSRHLCNSCKARNYKHLDDASPLARHACGSGYVPACQADGSGAIRACSHFEGSCGSGSPSCCVSCFHLSSEGECLNAEVVNRFIPWTVPVVCELYVEREV